MKNLLQLILCLGVFSILGVSCTVREGSGLSENSSAHRVVSAENLGMAYLIGKDMPENDEKAFYWFKRAAQQGSSVAANVLGYLYASGKGTGQNYQLALQSYQQAAAAGMASAKYNLGLLYENGLGTPVDKEKANEYFREAAALGFAPARRKI